MGGRPEEGDQEEHKRKCDDNPERDAWKTLEHKGKDRKIPV